ncbi:myocardin-related transcription factor B-like isoform X2 [Gigantopelta aegis]|uniref:myocardin-related transcription factor B-like isoform X2 n=1 Tax=Gigantopelta aegis TaxID=1735272 RepID=UPI001B88E5DA|nr:myocardin-related transcription factor B-like isoform X2 [Gigantopelta aegis]
MEKQAAEQAKLAAGGGGGEADSTTPPTGPTSPQTSLEEFSLQQSMDKNKESLKRKLMLRRSVNELVDRGIYPPLKTPPAFAEQRKQLERAKTGDLLRHKIQTRPDRQSLVQQHILEDTKIDRSLHERQRLLKRARLADDLNDKLAHRPGPLELVEGNILQSSEELVEAIKDGLVSYSKTDGDDVLMQPNVFVFDEESISDGVPSPPQDDYSSLSDISSPNSIPPAPELTLAIQRSPPGPAVISKSSSTGLLTTHTSSSPKNNSSSGNNNKSKPKKSKPKTAPKAKVIKFHEYKGPPSVAKSQASTTPVVSSTSTTSNVSSTTTSSGGNNNNSSSSGGNNAGVNNNNETPYHILLQQQQLFLQWQLEFQQKNMPFLLAQQKVGPDGQPLQGLPGLPAQSIATNVVVPAPVISSAPAVVSTRASVLPSTSIIQTSTQTQGSLPQEAHSSQTMQPSAQQHARQVNHSPNNSASPKLLTGNLEDLKVADLKAELKKRGLPVSGPKPQLIERLKPYTEAAAVSFTSPASSATAHLQDNSLKSIVPVSLAGSISILDANMVSPPSFQSMGSVVSVKVKEEPLANTSPPTSPPMAEGVIPMSPGIIDKQNVIRLKNQLNSSLSSIPMAVDTSRPPSVAPPSEMTTPMDVDQTMELKPNISVIATPNINTSIHTISPTVQQQIQQNQLQQQKLQKTQLQLQQLQQLQQQQLLVHNAASLVTTTASKTTSLPQVSSVDLLQQQQKHIEELHRQLQESQMKLKLQALHQQQLQQQNQVLLQQTVVKPPAAATTTPLMNTIQILSGDGGKQQISECAKPLRVPTQLLQTTSAVQGLPQSIPAVIVTGNMNKMSQVNSSLNSILKSATLHESLNHGKVNTVYGTSNLQPFIFTSTSTTTPVTSSILLNGITTTRPPSLPNSPIDGQKVLTRSSSSPFFNLPMREPPKYDDAIRSKVQHKTSPVMFEKTQRTNHSPSPSPDQITMNHKSPMMDDVLEILIRHGELPPSAADEPLPTPKTTEPMVIPPPVSSVQQMSGQQQQTGQIRSNIDVTLASSVPAITNNNFTTHNNNIGVKKDSLSSFVVSVPGTSDPSSSELFDLTEMLSSGTDLGAMDWSSDGTITGLDLSDPTTTISFDTKVSEFDNKNLLNVPISSFCAQNFTVGSAHGSEPDLASLGLSECDTNSSMQIDVSDWLDVIMPSTGLTPLSTNAPVSFSSDPILTPKTQQEVLDLFNFDESEFNTPTDPTAGLNWETLTEPSASSS